MRLLVNQAWAVSFDEYGIDDVKDGKMSFLYWVKEHFPAVQVHGAGQLYVYKALKRYIEIYPQSIDRVYEYFGGSGIGSSIIQGLFRPVYHAVYDIDPLCVEHLRRQKFSCKLHIRQADAKVAMLEDMHDPAIAPDLVAWDSGNSTALYMGQWQEQLDGVFAQHPKAVQMTDISLARLHLQRKRYSEILGRDFKNGPEYLLALADWVYERYQYRPLAMAYREFACMMYVPTTVPWSADRQARAWEPEMYHLTKSDGEVAVMAW